MIPRTLLEQAKLKTRLQRRILAVSGEPVPIRAEAAPTWGSRLDPAILQTMLSHFPWRRMAKAHEASKPWFAITNLHEKRILGSAFSSKEVKFTRSQLEMNTMRFTRCDSPIAGRRTVGGPNPSLSEASVPACALAA
jgi:hypothetical protein